ncbi:MAG TPA: HAD-IA family hydrolase [Gammaproteobacteria bacterium]|nr:HAD-IA family hydrolase [Gammaproteobacteria bacterium]
MQPIPRITFEQLAARYPVLLLDAYGVLVHATGVLPHAVERIAYLNRTGKPYFLLTNDASRLPAAAARRYRRLGLDIPAERIISSGELLGPYFAAHGLRGKACAVLGPPDSVRFVESAGGRPVPADSPFEVLVIGDETGYPFLETLDAALSTLFRQLDGGARVQLLVPNPDLIFPKSENAFGMAAGSIALMVEAALQLRYPHRPELRFARLGKPHRAIFEEAARRAGTSDMVMIGDQLETDIRGAAGFGIDSVLVTGGVAGQSVSTTPSECQPTYLLQNAGDEHAESGTWPSP